MFDSLVETFEFQGRIQNTFKIVVYSFSFLA